MAPTTGGGGDNDNKSLDQQPATATGGRVVLPNRLPLPPLNVYKKITIIRRSSDVLTYEDAAGNLQTVTDLGAATTSTPALQPKKKLDIPTPQITNVDTYEDDVPPTYEVPGSYVRFRRPTAEEIDATIEYNVDAEDEAWLANHPRFGPHAAALERARKAAEAQKSETEEENKAQSGGTSKSGSSKKQKKSSKSKSDSSPAKDAAMTTSLKGQADDSISDASVAFTASVLASIPSEMDSDEEEDDNINVSTVRRRPQLPLPTFEHMLDILEKATGFETIITTSQAERLLIVKIPYLVQIFNIPPGGISTTPKNDRRRTGRSVVTVKEVILDVYNYWVQKRSKLRKPLLRKFWPVTATNDTNPHLVFRPREKEKYKLRKKRQNDMEAYRKMKQLRTDFDRIRVLLDLVQRRERLNKLMIDVQSDLFDQRIYDLTDTSGLPRVSHRLSHEEINIAVSVPKYFDTSALSSTSGRKKKRRRGSGGGDGRLSPMSATTGVQGRPPYVTDRGGATAAIIPKVIAGKDNGTPAPTFLHPLQTRESYVTSWDGAVPFITNYVNSHPTPTFRFRHRPRIGRGGRVVIDRLPRPGHPNILPVNVYIAGDGLPRSLVGSNVSETNQPAERLLDLLPPPLDRDKLSRRIEELCLAALDEEDEAMQKTTKSSSVGAAGSGATGGSNASGGDAEENDGEEVLVRLDDWLDTDEQLWGDERFAIGPV